MPSFAKFRVSRRSLLGGLAASVAAPLAAHAATVSGLHVPLHADLPSSNVPGGVYIGANENPLGPCAAACEQITKFIPQTGRYDRGMEAKLKALFAEQNGLKPENINVYAGSSVSLMLAAQTFATEPGKSIVLTSPTFDSMFYRPGKVAVAPIHEVPLKSDHSMDVESMAKADPKAGIVYLCNPNNPTGATVTRDQIAWLLKNKPAGSILLIDEAYIHYTDAETALPFVAAGEDILVSRTFSKIYGMAGLRCGMMMGRPDLLAKMTPYVNCPMPTTALLAAVTSLQQPDLLATRRKYLTDAREETFAWLRANKYEFIPTQTNFFLVKVNRPGNQVAAALQKEKIFIGGPRPHFPDWVRISVGTPEEMRKFQVAFQKIMATPATA